MSIAPRLAALRSSYRHPTIHPERGCVVSYCPIASSIGARVLRQGGNAVDAAVATALALAVTYPQAGNLGGGGLMVLHLASGEDCFLDYRETSPARIRPELLGDHGRALIGALAVGVPGTVAGLAAALERFGTWSWPCAVAPAVELAERGVWLTSRQAAYLEMCHADLALFESTRSYFTDEGQPFLPGTLFRQPVLAATLKAIAERGPREFYEGEIAERIAEEIARGGGLLDKDDLLRYAPRWRPACRRRFAGREVVTAGLPSAGALVLQLGLGLSEASGAAACPPGSVERLALLARILRTAFATCYRVAGDPDLIDPAALEEAAALVERPLDLAEMERLLLARPPGPGATSAASNTTHFCVLDGAGNAVSNTFSLNTHFGAKLAVSGSGFLLNNSLDDFLVSPTAPNWYGLQLGDRNRLRPGARPASSMSPAIVLDDGAVEMIVGGSGGPRIPSLLLQLLLSVLVDGQPIAQAIQQPRIHHQYSPDKLAVEASLPESTARGLAARGYTICRLPLLGIGAGIHLDRRTKSISATLDSRFSIEWMI